MKKIFSIFLVFIVLGGIYINLSMSSNKKQNVIHTSTFEADGTIMKNDFREALMEFADEDDTLDSLDYVPEFLR